MAQSRSRTTNCEAVFSEGCVSCENCSWPSRSATTAAEAGKLIVTACDEAFEAKPPQVDSKRFLSAARQSEKKRLLLYFLSQAESGFVMDEFRKFYDPYNLSVDAGDVLQTGVNQGLIRRGNIARSATHRRQAFYARSSQVDWDYVASMAPVVAVELAQQGTQADETSQAWPVNEAADWLTALSSQD